jgi:hypothetical protein
LANIPPLGDGHRPSGGCRANCWLLKAYPSSASSFAIEVPCSRLLIGDVGVDHKDLNGLPLGIGSHGPSAGDDDLRAILAGLHQLALPPSGLQQPVLDLGKGRREPRRQQLVGDRSQGLLLGESVTLRRTLVPIVDPSVDVPGQDGVRRQVEERRLIAHGLLGLHSLQSKIRQRTQGSSSTSSSLPRNGV